MIRWYPKNSKTKKPSIVKKSSPTSPEEFDEPVSMPLPNYEEAPILLNKEIPELPIVDLMEVVEREANHNSQLIKTIKECPISYPIKNEAEYECFYHLDGQSQKRAYDLSMDCFCIIKAQNIY